MFLITINQVKSRPTEFRFATVYKGKNIPKVLTSSFVAKSWRVMFSKTRNSVKSRSNEFRFETLEIRYFLVFYQEGSSPVPANG